MKTILLGALALLGTFANAQYFGFKGGVNMANVSNVEDSKSKVGFLAGILAVGRLSDQFNIQPELLYSTKGTAHSGEGEGSLALNYVSIPIMLQYEATANIYIEAGPEFGILMDAKQKWGDESEDVKRQMKPFDVGIGAGGGYWFTKNIGLNLRYVAGLTDIVKDNILDEKYRNSVFQLSIVTRF